MEFKHNFEQHWRTKEYNEYSLNLKAGDTVIVDTQTKYGEQFPILTVKRVLKQYFEVEQNGATIRINLDDGVERGKRVYDFNTWRAYPVTPENMENRQVYVNHANAEKQAIALRNQIRNEWESVNAWLKYADGGEIAQLIKVQESMSQIASVLGLTK